MMKLTDIAATPPEEYQYLHRLVDTMPKNCPYILDCELPPDCVPHVTTFNILRREQSYVVYLQPLADYSGESPALRALCTNPFALFDSWERLETFFRQLPAEDSTEDSHASSPIRSPPAPAASVYSPVPPAPTLSFEMLRDELKKSVIGQDAAVEAAAYQTAMFLKKRHSKRPMSAVFFGPPASGKSECAKALAKLLSPSYHTVWTDLNQYTEAHSVGRLIGAPPSYVGYDDPPVFSEVASHRKTVFIFDELEKAHPEVLKLFMGILDEGRCQSNRRLEDGSRTYDFTSAILLFTSNAALDSPAGAKKKIGFSVADDVEEIRCEEAGVSVAYRTHGNAEEAQSLRQRMLRDTERARKAFIRLGTLPEIASRFGSFIPFGMVTPEAKERILAKQVVEAGFEYGLRISHIGSGILHELMAVAGEADSFTVRSYRETINGYLADCLADAGGCLGDACVRLDGSLNAPVITPAEQAHEEFG